MPAKTPRGLAPGAAFMTGARLVLLAVAASSATELRSRYDVVVVGSGLKESLLAGLLASHGKQVLQLDPSDQPHGAFASVDLAELAASMDGDKAALTEQKVGPTDQYRIERAPKLVIASGTQLQLLTGSGAWRHMNPPGFKRVHRAMLYRKRPDGQPDVHRVLANSEDVVKTRSLPALQKARVVQFYLWIERYDESDPKTHRTGPIGTGKTLDLHKMSAAKFLAFWEMPAEAQQMVVRGMALHAGGPKSLKKLKAISLVRRLKLYKNAYRTFPHMTSPYLYPVGGFGNGLVPAVERVLEANGGERASGRPLEGLATDESGAVVGVQTGGATVEADCVVAGAGCVPEHARSAYSIVRLYAVLNHAPNLCKDAASCQVILPAAHTGRASDIYVSSFGSTHGVAPKGKYVVIASARVEGDVEGGESALAVAKRELAAVLPILKPTRKLLAEVTPYREAAESGLPERLLVLASDDESSYLNSAEAEIEEAFERITGEALASLRL